MPYRLPATAGTRANQMCHCIEDVDEDGEEMIVALQHAQYAQVGYVGDYQSKRGPIVAQSGQDARKATQIWPQ